jgi:hypothetical protein
LKSQEPADFPNQKVEAETWSAAEGDVFHQILKMGGFARCYTVYLSAD